MSLKMKITFLDAGSTIFARNVLGDVMQSPALQQAELSIDDIASMTDELLDAHKIQMN